MDKINKVLLKSLLTNIFLSIFKIIFGLLGSSGALVADGIHSVSDMLTDIFSAIGNAISKKPADHEHPFGHGNAEYLTCLIIGITVAIMGIEVIHKGLTKEAIIPNIYTSAVCFITIIIKLMLATYLLKKGKEYYSNILISSGKESFSDVISSLIVLISVILSGLSSINSLFTYSDKVAMIIVGVLVLKIAYDILKDNLSNLLGKQILNKDYKDSIIKIINTYGEIKSIDTLIILKYGPFKKIDCEVSMDKDMTLYNVHKIIDDIEIKLKQSDDSIQNVMIHVNPFKKSK